MLVSILFYTFVKKYILFRNNTLSNLSDEELLLAHKESDKKIYMEELFDRYLPLIYGVCLKHMKTSEKAKGVVIQLLDDLLYTISECDIEIFRPWIYNVVRNHCLLILQEEEEHSIITEFNDSTIKLDNIVHALEEGQYEQTRLLTNNKVKISEPQRISITHFFMDGLSYAEIVDKTGYALEDIKSYVQAGKRNLKICLENNDQ